jgi:hypothetical protein
MRRLTVILLPVLLLACTGAAEIESSTTQPALSTTLAATTTSTSTTTTLGTTTTTTRVYVFEYAIQVYDAFDAGGSDTVGSPCVATSNANVIREGARITLRADSTGEIVATETLGSGVLEFDLSGPEIGERDYELFYFCRFPVVFTEVPLTSGGAYYFGLPTGSDSGLITANDLLEGRVTFFTNIEMESERQKIRLQTG